MTAFLLFGATGQTGRHFTDLALAGGHSVRAVVRTPSRLTERPGLEVRRGSITEPLDLDGLLGGVDAVIVMVGDAAAQRTHDIAAPFVRALVPAMRRHGVARLLYQAGGFTAPADRPLPLALRIVRATIARGYLGQHRDNERVVRYLADEAPDLEWMVHRAAISGDGPARGALERSGRRISIAPFIDVAGYSLRLVDDDDAIRTCSPSCYPRGAARRA